MEWLNYHHLHYFWIVVQEGSIAAASRRLLVGRPSISMQLKSLEEAFGQALLTRSGKRIELTEAGRTVFGYADVIFRTGNELVDVIRGRPTGQPTTLRVGVADVMAKLVTFQLLQPATQSDQLRLVCREDHPRNLFAALAIHELDLVLSDIPLSPGIDVRAHSHVLGDSSTTLFATPDLHRRLKKGVPGSLDGAPFLMPSRETAIRGALELWLEQQGVQPKVIAEFDDSALMKVFGQAGHGIFPAPTVVRDQVIEKYSVRPLLELSETRETFYAVSPERRVKNPAVASIIQHAKGQVFL